MIDLTIERATSDDAPALTAAAIAAFHDDARLYGVPLGGPPGYDSVEHMLRLVNHAEVYTYKITHVGQIVGGITVCDMGDGHFHLDMLFVQPVYHNRGIGTRALQFIEAAYPARKWSLDTPAYAVRNQHFYEKFGYVKIGEHTPEDDPILLFAYEKQV
jgi:GNAT superfamily N-acetyltransferase